jgi:predicted DNA-binding transcriptional regulator YafY
MRADRLVNLLMLLQTHPRLTCETLSVELEVSVRTIYRDLDALSQAGIPLYTERGPGGGVSLVEAYRTNLTGLSPQEARALFMLGVPAPLADLGVDQELKTALWKLAAALPDTRRQEESQARQRVHLDSTPWSHSRMPLPGLPALYEALWGDRRVRAALRLDFEARVTLELEPYGLVAKAQTWYLVARQGGRMRVDPAALFLQVEVLPETFTRPPDFDLAAFWEAYCREVEGVQPHYPVRLRVHPELFHHPLSGFSRHEDRGTQPAARDPHGWYLLELDFESLYAARKELLAYGGAVEVLAPVQLRRCMADFGIQIAGVYEQERGRDGLD